MNLKCLLLVFVALPTVAFPVGAATWDSGATPDKNWSAFLNWSDDASPANKAILFNDTAGATANATTVGNIVDASLTIDSLSYANSGATWQVTQIASGQTLTLDAATAPATILSVNGGAVAATNAAITGAAGTLAINESASNVFVGNSSTGPQVATLDMSGLGTFTAAVNEFQLGVGVRGIGIVSLAANNTITAAKLRVGDATSSTTSGSPNKLNLGGANTLNADSIAVGAGYASGNLVFRTGLPTTSSVVVRARDGSGSADLSVGVTTVVVNNTQGGTADFTGGTVDALINNLTIGKRSDTGTGAYSGTLSMSRGTFAASSVILGQTLTAASGTAATTGTVNVSGGTFTAGSILMAQNLSGARTGLIANLNVSGTGAVTVTGNVTAGEVLGTGTVAANINITAGTLLIQGNLKEGSGAAGVTSTVALSGTGILNMDHGDIVVDTFTMTGGTLKDVANFAAATSGGLNLQSSSKLAFGLNSGFTTLGLTGTLTLGATSDLVLTLANGFTPGSSYTLVQNDSTDAISGAYATINGSAFGAGNSFSLTNDMGTFNYKLSYTGGTGNDLMIVPEPATWALLAFSLTAVMVLRRRKP